MTHASNIFMICRIEFSMFKKYLVCSSNLMITLSSSSIMLTSKPHDISSLDCRVPTNTRLEFQTQR